MKKTVSRKAIEQAKENYSNECLQLAYQYEKDVLAGKIIVSEWIKKAIIREQQLRAKYIFKEEKVKDVFKFFYYVNILPKEQFKTLPFQA